MKNQIVSIIVPVYNVDKFIKKCLDSILCQTYKNLEILLIDDGSTDSSGKICDEYANIDSRVKVYHQDNSGVSSARNLGLDHCNGELISFIDSDDFVEPNYIEILLDNYENNSQIVICKFDIYQNQDAVKPGFLKINGEFTSETYDFVKTAHGRVWGTIFSKELIADLRFNKELTIGEDALFLAELIKKSIKIKIIPNILYHYIERDGSELLSCYNENKITEVYAWEKISALFSAETKGFISAKARLGNVSRKLIVKYSDNSLFKEKYLDYVFQIFNNNYKYSMKYAKFSYRVKLWLTAHFKNVSLMVYNLLKK